MRKKMKKQIDKTKEQDALAKRSGKRHFARARIWEDYISSQYSSEVAAAFSNLQEMSGEEMVETRRERLQILTCAPPELGI